MRYALALVHSWWWHLTYGMWRGYRETRTYETIIDGSEWGKRGKQLLLTSTDNEHRIVKVFWSHPSLPISPLIEGEKR